MSKYEPKDDLCEYCGDTVAECIDLEECNFGKAENYCGICQRDRCACDEMYESYKDQQADEHFDAE